MADNLTYEQRIFTMRRVYSKNTTPELLVRKILRTSGYSGYRLHRDDLPGKPDIAWIGKKLAIFINGCFWHGHTCRRGARLPKTNAEYWRIKIQRTLQRDKKNKDLLNAEGWRILTLWECELQYDAEVLRKIDEFMTIQSGLQTSCNQHSL